MFELSKYIVVVIYFLVFYLNFFCILILTPLVRPFYHLLIFNVRPALAELSARLHQRADSVTRFLTRFLSKIKYNKYNLNPFAAGARDLRLLQAATKTLLLAIRFVLSYISYLTPKLGVKSHQLMFCLIKISQ